MTKRLFIVFMLAILVLTGCKSSANKKQQRFYDEVGAMSKDQVLAKGDALTKKKKHLEARKYYTFLADSFPNDPLGRKAALKVADSFFAMKDLESLTEAQLRYKDFGNRFLNDPNRAYALLMLGKCSFSKKRGPLRDLTALREAADSFRQVIKLFPNGEYTQEAKDMLTLSIEDLAEHEYLIAVYYFNSRSLLGAQNRVDALLESYPETKAAVKAKILRDEIDKLLASRPSPTPIPTPQSKAKESSSQSKH